MKGSGVSGPAIGASRRQNPKRVPSGGYRDSGHRASDIGCQHHLSVPRYNRTAVIGQTISHYRITEKLGEGGMGVVYKAEDEKLRRLVALKFLPSNLLADDEVKARFIREAQAAASLNHPNICTVYAIDEFEGHLFIAMEYVEGETVRDKTKRGPLKLQEAVDLAVPDRPRTRSCAPERHRPPGCQGQQRHGDPAGSTQVNGLWVGPTWRPHATHEDRRSAWDRRLYVAGTDSGRAGRPSHGHLVPSVGHHK